MSKNNAEDFLCKKFVVLLFVKIIFYFLMDFFIPKKSTIGKISMAAMQNIPISFSFVISCFAPRIKLLPCTVTPNAVAHIPGVDPASIFKNDKRFIGKTFSFTVIIYRMCDFTYLCSIVEVNRRRNRKSLLRTLIRERNGSEKSWFLQGNACQGNSSKLQSLIAGVCRTFSGMQS